MVSINDYQIDTMIIISFYALSTAITLIYNNHPYIYIYALLDLLNGNDTWLITITFKHGVKRTSDEPPLGSEQRSRDEAIEAQQIDEYQKLVARMLLLREEELPLPEEVFSCTNDLILRNPDFITAWNLRRRALRIHLIQAPEHLSKELQFGMEAIKINPKSYAAWHHRQWLLETVRHIGQSFDLAHELKLCSKLLQLDARNFHCWNYRWYLTETFAVDLQAEFDFTIQQIYRNYSNYSAWHRRSLLFPRLEALLSPEAIKAIICSDFKLIKSAYFTEPADQSCWFYLRWLVNFAAPRLQEDVLERELQNILQLFSLEPDSPLALDTYLALCKKVKRPPEEVERIKGHFAQISDPLRKNMHKSLMETFLHFQAN